MAAADLSKAPTRNLKLIERANSVERELRFERTSASPPKWIDALNARSLKSRRAWPSFRRNQTDPRARSCYVTSNQKGTNTSASPKFTCDQITYRPGLGIVSLK